MPESTWNSILNALKETDFSGQFVWSRYSEPLSEKRIVDRIAQVRAAAPSCHIAINSNGDYLTAEYLEQLEEVGLNRLLVDIYIPDDENYDVALAKNYLSKFAERVDRRYQIATTSPEVWCTFDSSKIKFCAGVRNSASFRDNDLSNRGGLVQLARYTNRASPCYAPFKHLVVDWDGSVVVCCQVRSDDPRHVDTVVGKIGVNGVDPVSAYVKLANWRASLRGFGEKRGPCKTCNVFEYQSNVVTRVLASVLSSGRGPVRAVAKTLFNRFIYANRRY